MKRIVNGRIYNTTTSQLIADCWFAISPRNFDYVIQLLYRTKKGHYFLYGIGGSLEKSNEAIMPMDIEEAYIWLCNNDRTEKIQRYFSEKIEQR